MKVGDVVAWDPTRGVLRPQYRSQKVNFVGVVTEVVPVSGIDYDTTEGQAVYVIWNESTIPTLNDPRDVRVIEVNNEDR